MGTTCRTSLPTGLKPAQIPARTVETATPVPTPIEVLTLKPKRSPKHNFVHTLFIVAAGRPCSTPCSHAHMRYADTGCRMTLRMGRGPHRACTRSHQLSSRCDIASSAQPPWPSWGTAPRETHDEASSPGPKTSPHTLTTICVLCLGSLHIYKAEHEAEALPAPVAVAEARARASACGGGGGGGTT